MEITPKLIEQTRRWVTRVIHDFHGNIYWLETLSGNEFEQWHEDKAKDLLEFLNMSEADRMIATEKLHVTSGNPRRLAAAK